MVSDDGEAFDHRDSNPTLVLDSSSCTSFVFLYWNSGSYFVSIGSRNIEHRAVDRLLSVWSFPRFSIDFYSSAFCTCPYLFPRYCSCWSFFSGFYGNILNCRDHCNAPRGGYHCAQDLDIAIGRAHLHRRQLLFFAQVAAAALAVCSPIYFVPLNYHDPPPVIGPKTTCHRHLSNQKTLMIQHHQWQQQQQQGSRAPPGRF